MKEQVKAILFDFKDAGWSAQKVEKELGFSNGSLGKAISDYRFSKLLELYKKEIGKPLATTKEVKVQDANKTTGEVKTPEQPTTNYTVNTKAKEGDPKEGTMAFFNKFGCMYYSEIKK